MKVKLANKPHARIKGLLGTAQQELNFDALHIVPCRGVHTFGMKYSLDLAFLDGQNRVIACKYAVLPNRICLSPNGTRSVLERPASSCPWLKQGDHLSV